MAIPKATICRTLLLLWRGLTELWAGTGKTEFNRCEKAANSIALENSRRNSTGQRFLFERGGYEISVSAEERSCLEGVYTVRRSEKETGDESENKL